MCFKVVNFNVYLYVSSDGIIASYSKIFILDQSKTVPELQIVMGISWVQILVVFLGRTIVLMYCCSFSVFDSKNLISTTCWNLNSHKLYLCFQQQHSWNPSLKAVSHLALQLTWSLYSHSSKLPFTQCFFSYHESTVWVFVCFDNDLSCDFRVWGLNTLFGRSFPTGTICTQMSMYFSVL